MGVYPILPALFDLLLALLAAAVVLVSALIGVLGGLAQVWLKHHLEQRQAEDKAPR
jgi:hypothetical protein